MPTAQPEWNALSEPLQLALSRDALRQAAETLAEHAEMLAAEMEHGTLHDEGGADALRLLAAVVRVTNQDPADATGG